MKMLIKTLCYMLVLSLMCNMLPMSVFAQSLELSSSDVGEIIEPDTTEQLEIVEEITEKRTEYSKQFLLSGGMQMAVLYPDAVHYQKDGRWEEIDNRLTVKNGSYTNTEGVWNVHLPQQLSSTQSVVVEKDGYTLSFSMTGELKNIGLEIADIEEPPELEINAAATATEKNVETIQEIIPETSAETAPETTAETVSETIVETTTETVAETIPETTAETVPETTAETVPETTVESVPETTSALVPEETAAAFGEETVAAIEHITINAERFSVSGMQSSAATELPVDFDAMRASAKHPETIADKNLSRLRYENVFANTSILYDLQANTLKESIVLDCYNQQLRGYHFTLNVGQLIPVLLEGGQIDFYDADRENVIMSMQSPFMVDAAGEYCFDVQVSLTGTGSVYSLTYLLPCDWLADNSRQWPVVLDPVVSADLSRSNIEDCTVSERNENGEGWGMNACGYSSKYGVHRCYLQYLELPELTSSDVVIAAEVAQYKAFESSTITTVQVHKVTQTWRSSAITWSNKPSFNPSVEDFTVVDEIDWYSWDVTDIVRDWYANSNTGMIFKASDAIETGGVDNFKQFLSENYGVAEYRPQLSIFFRNNNGLENYWDYTSSSAGRAGTGYVNDFTGNLVWVRNDIGFDGNRMPVSISHIYNANDSTVPNDENNSNDTGGNYFGLGNGWRTNYHQRVYQWSKNSSYYIWEDSDGTDHYFYYQSANTYKDEDGLELTLLTGGSGNSTYRIKDKKNNTSYFDSYGRLVKLENNQQTKSSINITYTTTSGPLISTITDGANRVYSFFYSNDMLSRISFRGTNNTEHSYVTFGYSGNNLTSVTDKDNKVSTYTYNGNILLTAQDIDGYKLSYSYNVPSASWQPYRVIGVAESHNGASGGTLSIEYAHNQTTFTDHNNNVIIKQFNDYGNTVCTQDNEGHAQYAQYAINTKAQEEDNSDATKKGNQLRLSSNMQNTVGSALQQGSFESHTSGFYTNNSALVRSSCWTESYWGNASMQLTNSATRNYAAIGQSILLQPGESCTFSAYIKSAGAVGWIGTYDPASGNSYLGDEINAGQGWTRMWATHTNNKTYAVSIHAIIFVNQGTVYVDGCQLEKSTAPSRYNLVENGDFSQDASWYARDNSASTDMRVANTGAVAGLDDTVFQVVGDPTKGKGLWQDVRISGNAGDSFILSGWGRGDSAPLKDNRAFGLAATFHYADGTAGEPIPVSFNADADSANSWQYVAIPIVAQKAYSYITVCVAYDYNVNTAYFDGIQLYKEEFGSSYTYDEDGNVTSVVDLQKQQTTYEYTYNNLKKEILPTGAELTYSYDAWHRLINARTETGIYYYWVYDQYGNNIGCSVEGTIISRASYSEDGNRLVSTTDPTGKVTTYGYNAQTGVLEWVQYPEDTQTTRTNYSYDEMYRLTSAVAATSTGCNLTAEYTYANDLLTSVETASTTYSFTYGAFASISSISIGNRLLAEYSYTNDGNNYLSSLEYGNENSVNYSYDKYGRLIKQTYEDETAFTHYYDNSGNLIRTEDTYTGYTQRYFYDFTNRLVKQEEERPYVDIPTISYSYDNINNVTSVSKKYLSNTYTTNYSYDDDNRITSVVDGQSNSSISYDAYNRVSELVTSHDGTEIASITYGYRAFGNGSTNQVETSTINSVDLNGTVTYTYDDNGNIVSIQDGIRHRSLLNSYEYDSANQLIRENDPYRSATYTWTYDDSGNILSQTEYAYTKGALGAPVDTIIYGYTDSQWGDLLTSYDGTTITSDTIGNMLSDGTWTYTWEHGRRLKSMTDGEENWRFYYNAEGMRIRRVSEELNTRDYDYYYCDGKLSRMVIDSGIEMLFFYGADGRPTSFIYHGTRYYYVTNLQGDVLAILDTSGKLVEYYAYSAWGELLSYPISIVGMLNPLRYRGYIYDWETGLYYVSSRYYDPEIGRFISPDTTDVLTATPMALTDKNLYAYCDNNPVVRVDRNGQFWDYVVDIGFLAWSVADVVNDPGDWKNWAALAVDVVFAVVPFVPSGVGQVIKVGNKIDNALDVANAINKVDNIQDAAKVTMIGRNMDRVTNTASLIGKADNLYEAWKGYDATATGMKRLLHNGISMAHNGSWLFGKLRQGYTVIDIGLSTMHKGRGLWYGTERFVLGLWETRNIWKLPINYYS